MNFNVRQKKVINAKEPNIVCLAGAGCGKCIPNSTNIPTPDGWRKVEEIKIGDYLFDRQGNPTKVLGVYPQGKKEVYEITFGDGRQAKCSIDHIWSYYKIPNGKRLYSKTLEEILLENSNKLNKYKNKAGKYCYQIPLIEKVKYPKREYSIPPYILGLFLGDGSFREKAIMFSSEDDFLPKKIAAIMNWDYYRHKANKYCWYFKHKEVQKNGGYEFYKVKTSEFLKVYPELVNKKSEEKFIPEDYLMGSVEQRVELLRGLLDTDGCIGERGDIRYTTISEKLCKDMLSLIYSLGFKGGYYIENKGENKNKAYHISIQCNNQEKPRLFSVPKKYQRAIKISNKRNSHYSNTNPIIDIKRLNYEEEMTCFYVDNKEHLFAINDWCITHNTSVLTERISHLITENNVDPKKIVAITFTTMAAEEMKKRLGDIAEGAFIGTIHSYANAICIANGISTEKYVADAEFDKIIEKVLTIPIKRYFPVTHLLVDEFQDTGSLEYRFIERIPTENRFYIGDERQCQPAGTKVFLRNGVVKNIEDISPGDSVIWYDNNKSYLSGINVRANSVEKKVLRTSVRDFVNEELITITTENGLKSQYTPNHICFTKLKRGEYNHAVYLMCDSNNRFRVGKIPLTTVNSCHMNPWRDKMYKEGCTKIWLLKSFKTDKEARVLEQKISYKYSIPQTCWQLDKVSWTKEDIDYIYEGLDTYNSAKKCLKDYHRDIRYPLLDKEETNVDRNHFACNAVSEIYAINLMPECMEVIVYDTTSKSRKRYETIKKVEYKYISEPIKVYSLDVEGKTYVADGIVTHNCIYGFKGCSDEFLRMCHADISFTTYYLNQNYRCAPNILAYADSYLNTMDKISLKSEAVKTKDGIVEEDSTLLDAIEELEWTGDYQNWAIICRTNNELAAAVDFLDKRKIPNLSFKKGDLDLIEMEGLLRENKVKVLTIHTAKGLEFKKVIVIGAKIFNEEERKISYVAATRAEQALYCCPSICKRGKKGRPQNRDIAEAGKIIQQMAKNNIVF